MYRRGGACARRIGKDVTPMEPDYEALASLFPNIAAQLRSGLSNFYLAAAHLAPPEMREMDPELDPRRQYWIRVITASCGWWAA